LTDFHEILDLRFDILDENERDFHNEIFFERSINDKKCKIRHCDIEMKKESSYEQILEIF